MSEEKSVASKPLEFDGFKTSAQPTPEEKSVAVLIREICEIVDGADRKAQAVCKLLYARGQVVDGMFSVKGVDMPVLVATLAACRCLREAAQTLANVADDLELPDDLRFSTEKGTEQNAN